MSRLRVFLAVSILVVLTAAIATASTVVKIRLDDTIQPISEEYIGRAIEQARQTNADAVLIELSTPGGLVDSTRAIVEKMLASPVPVIVYVAPAGARAASAGFFILEAADVAAMAPGTNTGAAHPVTLGGEKMDDVMKQKVENDAAAFMRSFVGPRGRNVPLAESAVRESKSWTDKEALDNHLIDYIASTQDDLFQQISGKPIKRFDGKSVTLNLVGAHVVDMQMTVKQRILDFLIDPNIAFIVLAIGALALYAEFNHPGAVVPGVVGIVFILLALFALNLLPTRYAAFTLIMAAFVMFALEAKFATHGILGIAGIALMTIGGLLLVDGPIPGDACETLDGAFGERTAGADYSISDEHCAQGAAQQSRHWPAGNGWHRGRGAHRHRSGRKGIRAGRIVERACSVAGADGRASCGAQSRRAGVGSGEGYLALHGPGFAAAPALLLGLFAVAELGYALR